MRSLFQSLSIDRQAKDVALSALKSAGAFQMARRAQRFKLRILAYHGLWNADDGFAGDAMFIRPDTFRRRLQLLEDWGYRVVSLGEGLRLSRSEVAEDVVVITVDDGWATMGSQMWPTLQSFAYPATLYVDTAHLLADEPVIHVMAGYLGQLAARSQLRMEAGFPQPERGAVDAVASLLEQATDRHRSALERMELLQRWAAALHVDLRHYEECRLFEYVSVDTLRAMSSSGLDIQLHTHRHSLGDFGYATVKDEIQTNRRILSELCAIDPGTLTDFCYPSGRYSAKAVPVFEALGIRSASLTIPGLTSAQTNPYFLPRILDGDQLSELEFEAELCGLMSWLRETRQVGRSHAAVDPFRGQA